MFNNYFKRIFVPSFFTKKEETLSLQQPTDQEYTFLDAQSRDNLLISIIKFAQANTDLRVIVRKIYDTYPKMIFNIPDGFDNRRPEDRKDPDLAALKKMSICPETGFQFYGINLRTSDGGPGLADITLNQNSTRFVVVFNEKPREIVYKIVNDFCEHLNHILDLNQIFIDSRRAVVHESFKDDTPDKSSFSIG